MNEPTDREDAEFEARARGLLQESVMHVDGRVRSRLHQARHAAVEQLARTERSPWRRGAIVPIGLATAAAVTLVAVMTWRQQTPSAMPEEGADMDLLADGEAMELLENDNSFYAWAVAQDTGG